MIAVVRKELKPLPDSFPAQLEAVGISEEMHSHLIDACVGKVRNPTDAFGRTAVEIGLLRAAGYRITPRSLCSNCGEALVWSRGIPGKSAAYFRHNANTKCPGGFMTPWHAAMQAACAAHGFDTEYRLTIEGAVRKLDAYHPGSNVCIEFVSSLSDRYAEKHRQLIGFPIETAWFFNSGARFATAAHEERVDVAALRNGVIRIQNLFTEDGGCREIIEEIGRKSCYTLHRGLVFGCVGYDLWQCLDLSNPLQKLCVGDYGFNFQLYAQGKCERRDVATGEKTGTSRVVRARYPLDSGHRVDPEHLLNDLKTEVATGRLLRASALRPSESKENVVGSDGSFSTKLPSDNRISTCDGTKAVSKATSNLPMAEVAEQINAARGLWDGSDFEPWPTDRVTDIEVEELPPGEVFAVVKQPHCEASVNGSSSKPACAAATIAPTAPRSAAATNAPREIASLSKVNRWLAEAAKSPTPESFCCSRPMMFPRAFGCVEWDECANCGATTPSRTSKRRN